MGKRFTGSSVLLTLALLVSVFGVAAQQPRPRPRPAQQADLKIRYKTSMAGQPSESVTMIKGTRERSEMHAPGMDSINITQCDLKRTIQINEKTQKYMITPMLGPSDQPASTSGATNAPTGAPTSAPIRPGGVVTYVTNITDTGERKEMFGFTARHVKTSVTIKSSPDACSPMDQRMETDGWYIDLSFNFNCDLGQARMVSRPPAVAGGCRDQYRFRQEGTGKTGYPLIETTTMYGPGGQTVFTSTKEVLELSREPLEAALFDVPQGYTEAASSQELYGMPSVAEMMNQAAQGNVSNQPAQTQSAAADSKQPGTIRVGVVAINNKSNRPVSVDALRARLMGGIESSNIDAVPLQAAISLIEAEAEAKAKQCDFILFTDISGLKVSAAKKLGGLLGRAAGVGGIDKTEAKVEFKLYPVGATTPVLESTATAKEEGDDATLGKALDAEARAVSNEIKRRQ